MSTGSKPYSVALIDKLVNGCINFVFYYRLAFVFTGTVILAVISYNVWNHSEDAEKYKNISIVFSLGSVIIGIFYAILNYENNHLKYKAERVNARKMAAYSTIGEWHKPSMVENLKIAKKLYEEHKHLIADRQTLQFAKILDENEQVRSALVCILNFMEIVAIAVQEGLLDEEIIKKTFKVVFSKYSDNYMFYIMHRRTQQHSPTTWLYFTRLVESWRESNT